MTRDDEIQLLDEILGLRRDGTGFLDEAVATSPVDRYLDEARFAKERARLFRGLPQIVAHSGELPGDGAFLRREAGGVPLLLTRDRDGAVRAFLNVCRHRGARLVDAGRGVRHRFTCPYHGWTWDNSGRLIGVPHEAQGFPGLDRGDRALKRIGCEVRNGWIWAQPDGGALKLGDWAGALDADFEWAGTEGLTLHDATEAEWACNWKLLVEGGLESYHFRVAHAGTIGGMFHDNLSTYRMFGPHVRSVLARRNVDELASAPRSEWRLRERANVLYTLFPATALLVQSDHVVFIRFEPLSVDRTLTRCATFRPAAEVDDGARRYWDRNHALTTATLDEDFRLGESMQAGLSSGANAALTFGRFEGALARFNAEIDANLTG